MFWADSPRLSLGFSLRNRDRAAAPRRCGCGSGSAAQGAVADGVLCVLGLGAVPEPGFGIRVRVLEPTRQWFDPSFDAYQHPKRLGMYGNFGFLANLCQPDPIFLPGPRPAGVVGECLVRAPGHSKPRGDSARCK